MNHSQTKTFRLTVILLLATLVLWMLGLTAGSAGFETGLGWTDLIVQEIRLPRTLGAWLAGALLGLSGALAQSLFRNPLADPYLLGSASGAALGVALVLTLGSWAGFQLTLDVQWVGPWVWRLGLTGAAFLGAWIAVLFHAVACAWRQTHFALAIGWCRGGCGAGRVDFFIECYATPIATCDAILFVGQHQHGQRFSLCAHGRHVVAVLVACMASESCAGCFGVG